MERIIDLLKNVSKWIYKIQKILLEISVGVLIIINALQVAGRYFFKYSLPWSEQLSVVLFIVLIMLGGSLSIRTNTEIRISLLHFRNERKNLLVASIIDFFSFVTICALLISSILLTKQARELKQIISSLNLDYFYVYCVLILGFAIMGFEKGICLLDHIAAFVHHKTGEQR